MHIDIRTILKEVTYNPKSSSGLWVFILIFLHLMPKYLFFNLPPCIFFFDREAIQSSRPSSQQRRNLQLAASNVQRWRHDSKLHSHSELQHSGWDRGNVKNADQPVTTDSSKRHTNIVLVGGYHKSSSSWRTVLAIRRQRHINVERFRTSGKQLWEGRGGRLQPTMVLHFPWVGFPWTSTSCKTPFWPKGECERRKLLWPSTRLELSGSEEQKKKLLTSWKQSVQLELHNVLASELVRGIDQV